jgi:hypothetical protein
LSQSTYLYDKRETLLRGISYHKNELAVKIVDDYGLDSEGEWLHFRSNYTLIPKPESTRDFGTTSENVLYLAKLLRKNCYLIKRILNSMRQVVDEADKNNIDLPDTLYTMYGKSEELYYGIQGEIGFLATVVQAVIMN